MTTIILTIIGILLAAAAALMVIFYGGDAFNAGSVGARANTLQNAGTNVISAVQLYKADGKDVADVNTLTMLSSTTDEASDYLKEFPSLAAVNPSDTTPSVATISAGDLSVSNVPTDVCARVNRNLGLTTAPTTNDGTLKMGCAAGVFFANA